MKESKNENFEEKEENKVKIQFLFLWTKKNQNIKKISQEEVTRIKVEK